jgi:hypothetical protein
MEGHIEPEKSIAHNNEAITKTAEDTIVPATEKSGDIDVNVLKLGDVTPEIRRKINAFYGRKGEHGGLAPKAGFTYILDKIVEMTEAEAVEILVHAIEYHSNDVNLPGPTMEKIKLLIQGPKAMDVDRVDWEFDLKAEAAIIHYHSPYPEVRSVTDPFDDPAMPVETIRSWSLGSGMDGRNHGPEHLLWSPSTRYNDQFNSGAAASCSMWTILCESAARLGFHFPRDKTLSQSWSVVIQGTDFCNHDFHYSKQYWCCVVSKIIDFLKFPSLPLFYHTRKQLYLSLHSYLSDV